LAHLAASDGERLVAAIGYEKARVGGPGGLKMGRTAPDGRVDGAGNHVIWSRMRGEPISQGPAGT
jgi:hypothetical protein